MDDLHVWLSKTDRPVGHARALQPDGSWRTLDLRIWRGERGAQLVATGQRLNYLEVAVFVLEDA